jgi:hypothetical protein
MNRHATIIGSALALALGVSGATAHARSSPGILGHPSSSTSQSCFEENYGSIQNTCSGDPLWIAGLVIDPGGFYDPSINLLVPSGGSVTCRSTSVSNSFNISHGPQQSYTNDSWGTVYVGLTPGGVNVPAGGYLYAACSLSTNSQLLNITY